MFFRTNDATAVTRGKVQMEERRFSLCDAAVIIINLPDGTSYQMRPFTL